MGMFSTDSPILLEAQRVAGEDQQPLMAEIAKARQGLPVGVKEGWSPSEEQQSAANRQALYGFLLGGAKGGPGGALTGMGEAKRAYLDRAAHQNYLDQRLEDKDLTQQQRDALMARRYAGESFSATSRPWAAPAQEVPETWGTLWAPGESGPGMEELHRRGARSGTVEKVPGIPPRKRYDPSSAFQFKHQLSLYDIDTARQRLFDMARNNPERLPKTNEKGWRAKAEPMLVKLIDMAQKRKGEDDPGHQLVMDLLAGRAQMGAGEKPEEEPNDEHLKALLDAFSGQGG